MLKLSYFLKIKFNHVHTILASDVDLGSVICWQRDHSLRRSAYISAPFEEHAYFTIRHHRLTSVNSNYRISSNVTKASE